MARGTVTTDGSREIGYFFKILNLITGGMGTLADVLHKTLLLHKDDPVNKVMADMMKHDDVVMFEVENFAEADELRKKFRENGIDFSTSVAYKESVYVVIPKNDREKATEIVNDFHDRHSSGLYSAAFMDRYSNGKVQEIKDLTEEEVSLFVLRCKEQHVPVNVAGPSNGLYYIRFAEKDLDKMDRVRIDVAATLSGPAKDLYKDQIKWRNDYEKAIMNTIISGKYPDGSTIVDGSAIVGADGKSVEITRMYIKLHEGGSTKSFSRNAGEEDLKRSAEEISRFVKGIEKPVFLDRREYNALKDMDTHDREEFFASKERAGFLLSRTTYKDNLTNKAVKDRDPDGRKFHIGDMIVDDRGNSITVREKTIEATVRGETKVVTRGTVEAEALVKETIQQMHNPVFLNAARAKEYSSVDPSMKVDYVNQAEVEARTFVEGRHVLTKEEMEAVAKAEAMRNTIDVRLCHDGIEMPKTEKMTYHDASLVFGLTTAEVEGFNAAMLSSVVTEHDKDNIDDVVDLVEAHFGKTDPHETLIPIAAELMADSIFEGQAFDPQAPDHEIKPDFDVPYDRHDMVIDESFRS